MFLDDRPQRVARPIDGPFRRGLAEAQHDPDLVAGIEIEFVGKAGMAGKRGAVQPDSKRRRIGIERKPVRGRRAATTPNGFALDADAAPLSVRSNRPSLAGHPGFSDEFDLDAGDEVLVIVGFGETAGRWTVDGARHAGCGAIVPILEALVRETEISRDARRPGRTCGLLVHLCPTLPWARRQQDAHRIAPRRLSGPRNYDYRYAWIRDASLSLSLLSELGFTGDDERCLPWLAQLPPGRDVSLTVYRLDGGADAPLRHTTMSTATAKIAPGAVRQSRVSHARNRLVRNLSANCVWSFVRTQQQVERGILEADAPHRRFNHQGTGANPIMKSGSSRPRCFVGGQNPGWSSTEQSRSVARRSGRDRVPVAAWRAEMEDDPHRDNGSRLVRRK